jgi:hypothetical protein
MVSACRDAKLARQDQNINRHQPKNHKAAVRMEPTLLNKTLLLPVHRPSLGAAKRRKISADGIRHELVILFGSNNPVD